MDTSELTFYVTSDNFTGDALRSQPSELSPGVSQYQQQVAEHIQSFTSTFLSSQPSLSPADRAQIHSLSAIIPPLPPPRRVRAYIDGCYDILHAGHYNAIRQARSLCDELVLGIHSDAEIAHHKGPTVMNDDERVSAVRACKWIDQVVFNVPYDPSVELLDALGCEFCVHGDDQSITATGEDAFHKVKKVGRMKIVKRTEGISTTDLVGRLLAIGQSRTGKHQRVLPSPAASAAVSSPDASLGQQSLPRTTQRVSSFLPVSFRVSQFTNNRTPSPSDRVVYIAGDFDLFHVAHIDMLQVARQQGTFLYVGVYDDDECGRLKGEHFPVMGLMERVLNVLACRYVDEVVMGVKRRVSSDMMKTLNIQCVIDAEESERMRIAAKQTSHSSCVQDDCPPDDEDGYREAKLAGVYRTIPLTRDLTTMDVVERILQNEDKYKKRNQKRSSQEADYFSHKEYVEERRNRF